MYMKLSINHHPLCEVAVYSTTQEMSSGIKKWGWDITSSIYVANYSHALLKIPEMFDLAQKEFISDFASIQNIRGDYFEERNSKFPKPGLYDLNDKQFNLDKYEIINVIRDKLKDIATKWGLVYSED